LFYNRRLIIGAIVPHALKYFYVTTSKTCVQINVADSPVADE